MAPSRIAPRKRSVHLIFYLFYELKLSGLSPADFKLGLWGTFHCTHSFLPDVKSSMDPDDFFDVSPVPSDDPDDNASDLGTCSPPWILTKVLSPNSLVKEQLMAGGVRTLDVNERKKEGRKKEERH